jgi:SAM-dependent methyltransferase
MQTGWSQPSGKRARVFDFQQSGRNRIASQSVVNRQTSVLTLSEFDIRRVARLKCRDTLPLAILKQACEASVMRALTGIRFRNNCNDEALRAYSSMTPRQFEHINARQSWANWRTIPRNLNRRLPNRPLFIVDLCCGIGESTEVIACYAAPGSQILGLEYNERFVAAARGRAYTNDRGFAASVAFTAQSVLDTFRDADGSVLKDSSVDWANCSGAVGCHFKPDATEQLAGELARVIRPDGLATIDTGPGGTNAVEATRVFRRLGFEKLGAARSCWLDRYTQICFRRT